MQRRRFLATAAAGAGLAALGTPACAQQGFRMFDLCMLDPAGRLASTADMRGKVLFVHWWGAWCPPCKHEIPELAWMENELKANTEIRFVFLNGLEHVDRSLAFLKANDLKISQYNSLNLSRQERSMYRTSGETVTLNQLGIVLYPQTWIVDRTGLVVKTFAGENRNWRWWKTYVEDAAKKPWDGRTIAPADRLGWAAGDYAGGFVGADGAVASDRRIKITVEPGGADGQAKIAAQWIPAGAVPGALRAVAATPEAITLAGNFQSGNSLRVVVTPAGIAGVYQTGTKPSLTRLALKKAAA
ncbi:MAG: TlpA family protein disulfide reductase [Proteobacteria bacterium]|nr:TlpA family protein disulfide reductase [Pseudomonadota bacterium]